MGLVLRRARARRVLVELKRRGGRDAAKSAPIAGLFREGSLCDVRFALILFHHEACTPFHGWGHHRRRPRRRRGAALVSRECAVLQRQRARVLRVPARLLRPVGGKRRGAPREREPGIATGTRRTESALCVHGRDPRDRVDAGGAGRRCTREFRSTRTRARCGRVYRGPERPRPGHSPFGTRSRSSSSPRPLVVRTRHSAEPLARRFCHPPESVRFSRYRARILRADSPFEDGLLSRSLASLVRRRRSRSSTKSPRRTRLVFPAPLPLARVPPLPIAALRRRGGGSLVRRLRFARPRADSAVSRPARRTLARRSPRVAHTD